MPTNPVRKHFTFTWSDFYQEYKKSCKKSKRLPIDRKKYKLFIYDVCSELFKRILYESWHFVLPHGLGEFYIKEDKNLSLNFGAKSKKREYLNNKYLYKDNPQTFGKIFKFKWDKTYANFENSKYYNFYLIEGKNEFQSKYKVGKKAMKDFYVSLGNNPFIKMIPPYNKPIRVLEEPTYENEIC